MTQETFTVQGMTGVDLSLRIAGPGSRSYAFIIDWHIRLLLALLWLAVGMLLTSSGLRIDPASGRVTAFFVMAPPVIIYLLYHPVVELMMRGQTPGKRMAGVRIVNRDGGPPGAGAIMARNAFRLIDSLPMLYVVGLTCTIVTEQRLRIGDMAAGTLLVMNDADTARAVAHLASHGTSALDPAALDLLEQLLERWNGMDEGRRDAIARSLLQRIDTGSARSPADLADVELHKRLLTLAGRLA